jgi:hypothetical protein
MYIFKCMKSRYQAGFYDMMIAPHAAPRIDIKPGAPDAEER